MVTAPATGDLRPGSAGFLPGRASSCAIASRLAQEAMAAPAAPEAISLIRLRLSRYRRSVVISLEAGCIKPLFSVLINMGDPFKHQCGKYRKPHSSP